MISFLKAWGTLIVASIALLQPWAVALWRKFFRRQQIDIYETGTLEIGFSSLGPTIGLHGTLRGLYRDAFIRNVELNLVRLKDKAEHKYSWGILRSREVSIGSKQEITIQLCSSFLLLESTAFPFNIQFIDNDVQECVRSHIEPLKQAWMNTFLDAGGRRLLEQGVDLSSLGSKLQEMTKELYDTFSKQRAHVETYAKLQQIFYWESGDYSLTVKVNTARPNRSYTKEWFFKLTDRDVENLNLNVVKILQEACGRSIGTYNFVYPKYLDSLS